MEFYRTNKAYKEGIKRTEQRLARFERNMETMKWRKSFALFPKCVNKSTLRKRYIWLEHTYTREVYEKIVEDEYDYHEINWNRSYIETVSKCDLIADTLKGENNISKWNDDIPTLLFCKDGTTIAKELGRLKQLVEVSKRIDDD